MSRSVVDRRDQNWSYGSVNYQYTGDYESCENVVSGPGPLRKESSIGT
jgi:hypothetical protein